LISVELFADIMENKFEIIEEVDREYRRFKAVGTQLKVHLLPPPSPLSDDDDHNDQTPIDPMTHYETSMNALFDYALRDVADTDMVGLVIHHENSEGTVHKDKPIGFSFRQKDQLSHEVIWRLFEKVAQSNSRFNALDPLIVLSSSLICGCHSSLHRCRSVAIEALSPLPIMKAVNFSTIVSEGMSTKRN
jgi:hypothetical protein